MDAPPPQPPTAPVGDALAATPSAGHRIGGRYTLVTRVASGGMASVWEATDEVLARPVAVKLLHPHLAADEQFVARFRREALAAARLAHPAIVSIFDTCSDGATEAIVMELVRGTTLRAELDRQGRFEPNAAATVVAEIADALVAAHAAGIVHRDVKPANVLLSGDGRVLVADFGIAKAIDELELTGAGTTLGTAKYLAPEQVEGRPVDGRADVYAAGVILYELLCGRVPFAADTEAATALARLHRDPEPPRTIRPEIPEALEVIVVRALARLPEQRFDSAAQLRDVLRAFLRHPGHGPMGTVPGELTDATSVVVDATRAVPPPPPPGPPPGAPPPPAPVARPPVYAPDAVPSPAQPSARRRRIGIGMTAALVLVAVVVALVLAIQARDGGDDPNDGGSAFDREESDLEVVDIAAFDPQGDQAENDDIADLAVDGDASTAWRSECYRTPAFGNLKDGVGLIVDLGASSGVEQVAVAATPGGWSAEVYVAESASADIAGWGAVAGSVSSAGDAETVELDGAQGRFVLLFFTGLSDDANPDCPGGNPSAVSVTELLVT